jgi:DNA-binding MarR family transcriptional regulator
MRSDRISKVLALEALVREIVADNDTTGACRSNSAHHETFLTAVRAEISRRRCRRALFSEYDIFADPAWDIMLEMYVANATDTKLSITAVGLEAGVAPTTVLRWISVLENYGFVKRTADVSDKRRHWVYLTKKATNMLQEHFKFT